MHRVHRDALRHRPAPRAGSSAGRRGSSRRRSRSPAAASGPRALAGSPSPSRAITIPFISAPVDDSSRIASPVGDATSASCRCASTSSSDSTRNTPRCPRGRPASAPPGTRPRRPRARVSDSVRTAAKRGCGTPASASRRRIATLCVIRCALSTPIPGSPRASATAATTGTARSARDGEHAVDLQPRRRLQHRRDVGEVDDLRDVGLCEPRRVGVPVDGRDAQPSSFARSIARRWWRPAPTKRTVRTDVRSYFGLSADRSSSSVPSTSIREPNRAACCPAIPSKTIPRKRPNVSSGTSSRISPDSCGPR